MIDKNLQSKIKRLLDNKISNECLIQLKTSPIPSQCRNLDKFEQEYYMKDTKLHVYSLHCTLTSVRKQKNLVEASIAN